MSEIKVGSTVLAVWPNDPKRVPRPGIVVAILRDGDKVQARVVYGTTKSAQGGTREGNKPWCVLTTPAESSRLGFRRQEQGRFDTGRLRLFVVESLTVVGNIDAVRGLNDALVAARKVVPKYRGR